jgi:hypothetical protein
MKCLCIGTVASLGLLLTCFAGAQEATVDNHQTLLVKLLQPNRMSEDVEIFRRILNHKLDLPRVSTFPALANPNLLNQPGSGFAGVSGGMLGGNLGLNGSMGIGGMGSTTIGGGALGLAGGQGFGGGNGLNTILTTSRSSVDYPAAEGVYLKGYGVVYNLVLPPQPKPHAKEATAPTKPISEWDRIRKEMHGDKVTEENKPIQPKQPTLTENLIKLLAENGHHFAQLGDKENITIVITFREPKPTGPIGPYSTSLDFGFPINTSTIQSGDLLVGVGVNSDQGLTGTVTASSGPQVGTQSTSQQEKPNTSSGSAVQPSPGREENGLGSKPTASPAKDLLLLADLNFKQSKFAEAEALYRKALEALATEKDNAQRTDILRKLAQILVANGKYDEAKKLLEQILAKKVETKAAPKETPKPLPLPAKLIITASKELLNQVGTNRIDLEAFRKAVSVEYENTGPIGISQTIGISH